MKTSNTPPSTIDEYIAGFPPDVRRVLDDVRATIRKAAPDATEAISYRIPTFTLHGSYLVYFAAHAKHIGVYPAPVDAPEMKKLLAPYAAGKGTVQFPLDKPIPFDVITKIVQFRAKDNLAKAAAKTKKKGARA
ncbi:MAG TPA: DUF1801 domain-containing protein [Gemmatimonadaceae bacterium]|nr:DUF1801 domain-containing protein [Gemmatimonadaceae bacterium]